MRELASLEKGKIEPNSDFQWRNELLYIPPIPPTNLRGCSLIRIQYDVYVRINDKQFDCVIHHLQYNLPLPSVSGHSKGRSQDNKTAVAHHDCHLSTAQHRWNTATTKGYLLPVNTAHDETLDEQSRGKSQIKVSLEDNRMCLLFTVVMHTKN